MSNTKTKSRRTRGDGSIFQTKEGKWIARFNKKGLPSKEFHGDSKTEVKERLDEWKNKFRNGDLNTNNLTIRQYAEKFLQYKASQNKRGTFKNTSLDRIERTYNSHIKDSPLAYMQICNLTCFEIQHMIDEKQDLYSYSEIKKLFFFFKSMISFGIDNNHFPITFNPCKNVELPKESTMKVRTKDIEIMSDSTVEIFSKYAMETDQSGKFIYRYGPALVFALNTGIREGELLALSKDNILVGSNYRRTIKIDKTLSTIMDRNNKSDYKTIRVLTEPKYPRSKRIIPLNNEANYCLNHMLRLYGDNKFNKDLIIATTNGLPPTSGSIQGTLDRILRKAGLPHYGTHALRHTFATRMLKQTSSHQDIKAVAELLGDDYNVVIKTYLHTDHEEKFQLIDRLNAGNTTHLTATL